MTKVLAVVSEHDGEWPTATSIFDRGLRDRNSPSCTLSQNGYGDREAMQRAQPLFCDLVVNNLNTTSFTWLNASGSEAHFLSGNVRHGAPERRNM